MSTQSEDWSQIKKFVWECPSFNLEFLKVCKNALQDMERPRDKAIWETDCWQLAVPLLKLIWCALVTSNLSKKQDALYPFLITMRWEWISLSWAMFSSKTRKKSSKLTNLSCADWSVPKSKTTSQTSFCLMPVLEKVL